MKYFLLLFVAGFLGLPACKKENATPRQCRIITAVYKNGSTTVIYNIGYNNEGQLSEISITSGSASSTRSISYSGNSIMVESRSGSTPLGRTYITLDDRKNIINIKETRNASGTDWINNKLSYDGNNNLLKEVVTYSGSSSVTTNIFTIANGDIISETDGTNTNSYQYYTDQPFRQGDFFWFVSVINYCVEGYRRNAHLIQNVTQSGSFAREYVYEYNNEGLITKLNGLRPGNIYTIDYQYECK